MPRKSVVLWLWVFVVVGGGLAACAAQPPSTLPPDQGILLVTVPPTATPLTPVPTPTMTAEVEPVPVPISPNETWQDLMPQPTDEEGLRAKVFGVQAKVTVRDGAVWLSLQGQLPTPCHRLRVEVARQEDLLLVHVYAVLPDPTKMCVQTLKPFAVQLRLDVPPMAYKVQVQTP